MRTQLLTAAVLLGVIGAGCDVKVGDKGISLDLARGKATDQWVRRYTLPPGGQLEIAGTIGGIEVTPASGPAVEVQATREAVAASDDAARQLLTDVPMVEQVTPGHVRVAVARPRDGAGFGIGRRVTVQYHVQVPAGLTASFRTENGALRLDRVDGRFDVATVNGSITGRDLAGSLTASTVNGGIQMGLASVAGDVRLTTVNGSIRIELPPSLAARVEATTVNGGVDVDGTLSLTGAERGRGHVAGTLNGGGPTIAAQTTNGPIRLLARAAR